MGNFIVPFHPGMVWCQPFIWWISSVFLGSLNETGDDSSGKTFCWIETGIQILRRWTWRKEHRVFFFFKFCFQMERCHCLHHMYFSMFAGWGTCCSTFGMLRGEWGERSIVDLSSWSLLLSKGGCDRVTVMRWLTWHSDMMWVVFYLDHEAPNKLPFFSKTKIVPRKIILQIPDLKKYCSG